MIHFAISNFKACFELLFQLVNIANKVQSKPSKHQWKPYHVQFKTHLDHSSQFQPERPEIMQFDQTRDFNNAGQIAKHVEFYRLLEKCVPSYVLHDIY